MTKTTTHSCQIKVNEWRVHKKQQKCCHSIKINTPADMQQNRNSVCNKFRLADNGSIRIFSHSEIFDVLFALRTLLTFNVYSSCCFWPVAITSKKTNTQKGLVVTCNKGQQLKTLNQKNSWIWIKQFAVCFSLHPVFIAKVLAGCTPWNVVAWCK